jgi:hypothetical protein
MVGRKVERKEGRKKGRKKRILVDLHLIFLLLSRLGILLLPLALKVAHLLVFVIILQGHRYSHDHSRGHSQG